MKLRLLSFSAVLFLALGLVWYFAYPLKIESLLRHTATIEKIDCIIIAEGESKPYSLPMDDHSSVDELIDILGSERYTRELNTYKGSTDRVIIMTFFYRNAEGELGNYSFDINESGVLISDQKQYQMKGETEVVFNELYEWILHKS
ncbi:hypothetical protein [Paenibacillus silvisoli]|uniref:hypothetical protein n=1 Tax=Paenibacillus silvisoli TaxID=3110539 RepID=UPI002805FCF9|nr:hypothetical protein [Paenibacillus silvisoli]